MVMVPMLPVTPATKKPIYQGMLPLMTPENRAAYWSANLRLLIILLTIWFLVSYGFGILLVDVLNTIAFGGYKLGFWFAQQGAMYTFLVLIFVYAVRMGQLDRKFGVHED